MITKTPEGKMETVLWRMNNPGSVCYDVQRRNLYVVEVFRKTTKSRKIRSTADTLDQNSATDVGLWSTIMVGAWAGSVIEGALNSESVDKISNKF